MCLPRKQLYLPFDANRWWHGVIECLLCASRQATYAKRAMVLVISRSVLFVY